MRQKRFITCDGNYAASYVSYMFSEVAAIYPITPSSNMAENVDEWAAEGKKNIFGNIVKVVEMQSEAGAAGAVHGSLQSGVLTTTYTASQGLLLMIPNMYKIAGELLPGVFHVSARAVAAQALSIFGDHSDVMTCRMTGFAMLATGSVQEIMDIGPVAHLAAIKSRVPFLHFFDGFRTSHEIQKVEYFVEDDLRNLIDWNALEAFRNRALNSEHPVTRGTAQNPDIYFQTREVANPFYERVPDIVEEYMQEITKLTGREYHPFTYYGAPDAEYVIVAMGSVNDTIRATVDYLISKGEKVGSIAVHLYRPFSKKYFLRVMPSTVKRIAVLDRTKEHGSEGEPLYLDVKSVFYGIQNAPLIVGGRYGLSSKDTTPSQIISVFLNLKQSEPKNRFTIGIIDDVTFTSLPQLEEIDICDKSVYQAKFYGIGSDGTVGANKNSIKIIGDNTDKYCQAYFAYDSKKSGGFTVSHLRFGDKPIRAPYLVSTPDFVACHVPSYLGKYNMLKGIKEGGTFLLNTIWSIEETIRRLPNSVKKTLAKNKIKFYVINATAIAEELGLGNRINTIMQSAFFKVTNIIPYELAVAEMKEAVEKTYGKKGDEILQMNFAAIDRGGEVIEVPVQPEWIHLPDDPIFEDPAKPDFVLKIADVMNRQEGDSLPVSAFVGREDGTFPPGTTKYEKRGIAVFVPKWIHENCIQCNQCAYVCPHAAIRPFLLTEEEVANLPFKLQTIQGLGALKQYQYRIQVSVLDCTGCGVCINTCPAKEKALVFSPLDEQIHEADHFKYLDEKIGYKDYVVDKFKTVRNSQFAQPLFEFSGACAGCGETPYIKLITQLYGERMIVANATGCSSIYGGSAPSTPYTFNYKSRKGVAWANSLFEDNAEYGFGIALGYRKMRENLAKRMTEALPSLDEEFREACQNWLNTFHQGELSVPASQKLLEVARKRDGKIAEEIIAFEDYLIKKSVWIIGGDGWAYDIGYGGLDHVIASGEDVNILVLDTEVYSNTGGQSSKASPLAAVAKFAAAGKRMIKKDLGLMAMTYGYVYVAQVAMGADQNQFFKAVQEAEQYPGPSLIIAYSTCINHGLRYGMSKAQEQQKLAVEAGYWFLYRYNPLLEKEGKNPFQLDSKEPDWSKFQSFLQSEVRFTALAKTFPKEASELFIAAEEAARKKYQKLRRLAEAY
ncbi:MAG: pyruvate:ferredoxin (flavodoxin) oxidoreductase [Bacteroidales bacterium]|nr:pyruvate:ferredoxin (flavodoxin) oxidoreductase [Bacteroidales bacterium]